MIRPEILAPVGGRPQLAAAIEAGADAVYFGLSGFNARARAANFTPAELPEIMAQLHERGVSGFVTLNTLVFDEELREIEDLVRAVDLASVDAVIVQDLGVAARIREIAPDLPLHGSTQMTVTSAESAELVARLGLERVVLGRELSVKEIAHVRAHTDLEVEVFVHGALCVSYSGQCFSSEAWGGRSANRGLCAQACRLPYGLVVDGVPSGDEEHRHVLSPQDLYGVDFVPTLIEAGVSCFKIEGRLKGPDYVALTTQTYRRAVDGALAGRPWTPSAQERLDLEQVFSRGLTPGFLEGSRHQRLVRGRSPKHRGVRRGVVTGVQGRRVEVDLEGPLRRGDGVIFEAPRPQDERPGGDVHTLLVDGRPVEEGRGRVVLKLGPGVRVDLIEPGDRVWRNKDPALRRRLAPLWERETTRCLPVRAALRGAEGQPLHLRYVGPEERVGEARSEVPLQPARGRGLDDATLKRAIGRLGGTPLTLAGLDADGLEELFLPISALNRLRREAATDLLARLQTQRVRSRPPRAPARVSLGSRGVAPVASPDRPQWTVLCRTPEQVEAALEIQDLQEIAVDFLEVKGLGQAVASIQARGRRAVVASPRVLKPREENLRAYLLKLGADALLVRSLGLLRSLLDAPSAPELFGDFSLNATNRRTVDLLLEAGLSRLAPGHDLNRRQLVALPRPETAGRLEVIVHHHLPVFHTEHCVFARFLSDGDDKQSCGAPCERHVVHLDAPDGQRHLVQADMGCRNTVFNGRAQSAVQSLPALLRAGYRRFRIELVDHRPEEVAPLLARYLAVAEGGADPRAAWAWLRDETRFSVTQGSLRVVDPPVEKKRPGWMA